MTIYVREDIEFVRPNAKKHPQRSTIQHWQLRDLIACPTSKSEFFYVNQNNVLQYHTERKEALAAMKDLSFSPTSITSGHGYLAAGGQRSQLTVRSLTENWHASTTVGGSINNAMNMFVTPYAPSSSPRLLICNNDETIKMYALPSMQRVATISLPTAVNYASVSPDGRRMVAVGDSNQVFVFEGSSGDTWTRVATLTATKDAGFSCAWNHSSTTFAVASQDGFVSVWDIRSVSPAAPSSNKLAQLDSRQNPQVKGACRSVKFSPVGGMDLLMYSEHMSYVSIVDARTFGARQTIRVAPTSSDQHISGICFSPDSRTAFVGMESNVWEFEVDTLNRRCFPEGSII
ncbi:WD40-repeat-containing domain protein [Gaertneriomyces semiglobifer]|nr:WD40-repeat-containing domain protein [Gaertneriomyces semiglobifer]